MANIKDINLSNNFELMRLNLQTTKLLFSVVLLTGILISANAFVFPQVFEDEEEFIQGDKTTAAAQTGDDFVKLFYQAQEAHAKGDLEAALKLYQQALTANPEFPEAEYQKGSIYKTLGKYDLAEKAFRRAVELRRDWTLPIAELGGLLVRKGDYTEAEIYLNQAIRIDSMSFPAYVSLTELKLRTAAGTEELKLLLGKLQYLTSKAKIPAAVWAARAAIERRLNDKAAAKNSIKRALLIDEKNSYALEENIEISLTEGDTKGAVKNSQVLLEFYPNSINAKLLLARSLHVDGKSDEAIKILNTIENPRSDITELKLMIALGGSNDVKQLEEFLARNPDNTAVLGRLCTVSRRDQPDKALRYCEMASKLEPKEINHAIGYGAALVKLKNYAAAVALFKKLLEVSPENYTIRANMATALFQLNRFEEAKKEYIWITQKQPELAVTYYFLAISHDRLGEYLDAMANYQQFLRLAGDDLKLEIERVNLRLPSLQRQIKQGKGKK